MAPSRGKGKGTSRAKTGTARRSTRSRASGDDVPDVYQSMLQEADAQHTDEDIRPLKKRRVAAPSSAKSATPPPESAARTTTELETRSNVRPALQQQTVEDSSESDNSDFEFEDVDLGLPGQTVSEEPEDGIEDLSISIQAESSTKRSGGPRRKPATYAEKAHRLIVHKLHVLCLLGSSMYTNGWCNNAVVWRHLRPLLSSKTVSYLNPKADFSQFQRSRSFKDGLQQAVDTFSAEYQITDRGMQRPHWDVDGDSSVDKEYAAPMDRADFIAGAKNLAGSQDLGNQLFCALLRSVGVQARLVCSLQPLPFGSVPKASTPKKPAKQRIMALPPDLSLSIGLSDEDSTLDGSQVRSIRRRLGQPSFSKRTPQPPQKKAKPVPKLTFPIYWIEAFNTATQKWIAVDAVVTRTVDKPTKLEPASSYEANQLTYAIAFEEHGAARDVTKRYAKAFNAKTRRFRVESSNEGARWLKKTMRIFRRPSGLLDRDQVEDAELAQKEAREGMPANVLDFKDHPFYALERHLRRHEVIFPKREVGKVNAGTAAKPRMEAVYRRQDLLACKSSEKWYRCGREIKAGEQPLKHITKRTRRQRSVGDDHEGLEDNVTSIGLYAPMQTQPYIPPPVEKGRVPKNVYGNLDIYVSSMVPAGGTHVRHKLAKDAARVLRVDYAEAVTGFSFKGRHGTAIVEGAIVATQFADAVRAVIDGFEDQVAEDESRVRSLEALRLWKKFAIGLRIVERVSGYGDTASDVDADDGRQADDHVVEPGGFLTGITEEEEIAMPTAGRFTMTQLSRKAKPKGKSHDVDSESDPALVEDQDDIEPDDLPDTDMAGGFMPAGDSDNIISKDNGDGFLPDSLHDDGGGGFMVEDGFNDGDGDGFMVEDGVDDAGGIGVMVENDRQQGSEGFNRIDDEEHTEPSSESSEAHQANIVQESAANETMAIAETESLAADRLPPSSQQGLIANDVEASRFGDDNSERGSLLSHDPEDEDAEPDWLESD